MPPPLTFLRRSLAAGAFLCAGVLPALADCTSFTGNNAVLMQKFRPVVDVQLGLRTAFGVAPAGLSDGMAGPRTWDAIGRLCNLIPPPQGRDVETHMQEVLREFAALGTILNRTGRTLSGIDLSDDPKGTRWLALAATPALTAREMTRTPGPCSSVSSVLASSPDAMNAMTAMKRIFAIQNEAQICALFSAPSDPDELRTAFARLGRLDRQHENGKGIETLLSAGFQTWIAENRDARLPRLLATEGDVLALLNDYVLSDAASDDTSYSGGDCGPSNQQTGDLRFRLTKGDIASVNTQVPVLEVLQTFARDAHASDSMDALWSDLQPVLAAALGDCALSLVKPLLTGPEQLPRSFGLTADDVDHLTGLHSLQSAGAILEQFQYRTAPTKAEFTGDLRNSLAVQNQMNLNATVEDAAKAIAAASASDAGVRDAPVSDSLTDDNMTGSDTVRTFGVTEAADAALEGIITDARMRKTLRNTAFEAGANPEIIRQAVRSALAADVRAQVTERTDDQIAKIGPLVKAHWGMTEPLIKAITGLPYVRAAMKEPGHPDLAKRLESLMGVEYTSPQDFRTALEAITNASEAGALSPFMIERIMRVAAKTDPEITGDTTVNFEGGPIPPFTPVPEPEPDTVPETSPNTPPDNSHKTGRFVAFPDGTGAGMWLTDTHTGTVKFCVSSSGAGASGGYLTSCIIATQQDRAGGGPG